jgi:hypothetical protein
LRWPSLALLVLAFFVHLCGKVLVWVSQQLQTISHANRTWTIWRAPWRWIRSIFCLKNISDARLRDVFQAAAKSFGWPGKKVKQEQGFGLGGGIEKGGYVSDICRSCCS